MLKRSSQHHHIYSCSKKTNDNDNDVRKRKRGETKKETRRKRDESGVRDAIRSATQTPGAMRKRKEPIKGE